MRAMVGLRLVMAVALAAGAFGCVNSSTSHDGSQSVSSAQTSGASLGDDSAQARSESTRDTGRVIAGDTDHGTRHADRGGDTGGGPNPVPWSPSAGMRNGASHPFSTSGTIRVANPYNQR